MEWRLPWNKVRRELGPTGVHGVRAPLSCSKKATNEDFFFQFLQNLACLKAPCANEMESDKLK